MPVPGTPPMVCRRGMEMFNFCELIQEYNKITNYRGVNFLETKVLQSRDDRCDVKMSRHRPIL